MRLGAWIALTVLACTTFAGCGGVRFIIDAVPAGDAMVETAVMDDGGSAWFAWTRPKVALIDVTGVIVDAQRGGLVGLAENPVSRFTESLRKAEQDSKVKAVVIRINSPGGGVTASDLMYRELMHFRARAGKPVVISMADVAASGGYYLACGGDEIIAHPTSITGSIGVIMQTFNVHEGLRKIGVRAEALTSGPNKSMGSPFEPMPEEHRRLLQDMVDEFYINFRQVVIKSRPQLEGDNLKWITDGRAITGQQAASVGVVDRVGDLRDAFQAAKSRAGLERARLVKYHRPLEQVGSAYALAPIHAATSTQINLMQFNVDAAGFAEQPTFFYLWDPTVW